MQNKGLRPRVPKGFMFIVTAFDITLKLTQQVSKNCRQRKRKKKGRKTLVIHRNQDPLDTSKICFDTFKPVNVANSDLNHSIISNMSAITRFPWFQKWISLIFQMSPTE